MCRRQFTASPTSSAPVSAGITSDRWQCWYVEETGNKVDKITTAGSNTSLRATSTVAPDIVTGSDNNYGHESRGKDRQSDTSGSFTEYALASSTISPKASRPVRTQFMVRRGNANKIGKSPPQEQSPNTRSRRTVTADITVGADGTYVHRGQPQADRKVTTGERSPSIRQPYNGITLGADGNVVQRIGAEGMTTIAAIIIRTLGSARRQRKPCPDNKCLRILVTDGLHQFRPFYLTHLPANHGYPQGPTNSFVHRIPPTNRPIAGFRPDLHRDPPALPRPRQSLITGHVKHRPTADSTSLGRSPSMALCLQPS